MAVDHTNQIYQNAAVRAASPLAATRGATVSTALGAVTVKLISSSVNPSDVDSERQGVGGILGADFVGTVTAVGAGAWPSHMRKVPDPVGGGGWGGHSVFAH